MRHGAEVPRRGEQHGVADDACGGVAHGERAPEREVEVVDAPTRQRSHDRLAHAVVVQLDAIAGARPRAAHELTGAERPEHAHDTGVGDLGGLERDGERHRAVGDGERLDERALGARRATSTRARAARQRASRRPSAPLRRASRWRAA